MSLMEQFANPDTMHSLSLSDKLAGAGITTLMGMGITFVILILLWGCIATMNKVMNRGTRASKKKLEKQQSTVITSQVVATDMDIETATSIDSCSEDEKLIAVITAAVTAHQAAQNESLPGLVVRKILRTGSSSPIWASAGRGECVDSRRV